MKIKILLLATMSAVTGLAQERLIIVNEGLWQADNGRLSFFEDGEIISNQWFRDVNGSKLGDTPNDIIRINANLIAIAVNWSNIVQFITPEGKAVGATEEIPNNRKLATDGEYVYVTSYAHEVCVNGETREFEKGYVAKIDAGTLEVTDAVEVGYEPEGIAYYEGHLFVANSGGYAFQENHEYETTVSVVDAVKMEVVRTVDTGQVNLFGKMSQSGKYLCISSPGDYYSTSAACIILDCDAILSDCSDEDCFHTLEYPATHSAVDTDGNFLAIGSGYSYYTGDYEFNYITIDPKMLFDTGGEDGVTETLPGNVKDLIQDMTMPYGIYVNPFTGYIYATDAGEYTGAGALYQWTPEGEFVGKYKTYINPSHFLALEPENNSDGISEVEIRTETNGPIYSLQGLEVSKMVPGHMYIKNGHKFIHK